MKKYQFINFISNRISPSYKDGEANISQKTYKITIFSLVISVITMLISISIIEGFKIEILDKVSKLNGDIIISSFELKKENKLWFKKDSIFENPNYKIKNLKSGFGVALIQGIIKTEKSFQSVILKCVDKDFSNEFYDKMEHKGQKLSFTNENEILISETILKKLNLSIGSNIIIYFADKNIRRRNLKIVGIFNTGFKEFDNHYLFGDINLVRKINNWDSTTIEKYEIHLEKNTDLTLADDEIYNNLYRNLISKTSRELFPDVYQWLETINVNSVIIITLMLSVAIINMISFLLLLILSKINLIGMLKTLGVSNSKISYIFILVSFRILLKSLFFGNGITIILLCIQKYFNILTLNSETYFISHVPVSISFDIFFKINLLIILITIFFLILPSFIISKIKIIKSIKFS